MTNPATTHAQRTTIERIVRQVLAELTAGGHAEHDRPAGAGQELHIAAHVITAKEIEKQLHGVTRLVISRGAILTPSARDLLRERRIALATAVEPQAALQRRRVLVAGDGHGSAAPLIEALTVAGAQVESISQPSLATIVDHVGRHVSGTHALGVIATDQPVAALCLVNRLRGVRAALARNVADVTSAITEVGANVLVVHTRSVTNFEWLQMARVWLHAGRHVCPAELAPHLE